MNVIDLKAIRNTRELQKRYEYIQSMTQLAKPELFDELIAEQKLTDEKIASCRKFMDSMKGQGRDPLIAFQEASFMYGNEDDYYKDNGVEWHLAIEESLTFYAVLRKHDKDKYNIALELHPYVGGIGSF